MLEKKKKNQRVINRTALIGPFLGPLVYMGGSPVILCGSVCHCVNPGDGYWVFWKLCFGIWGLICLWGKFARLACCHHNHVQKSCRKQARIRDVKKNLNRILGRHFSSTLPYSSSCVSILSFHWSQYSLDLCPCVFLVIYVQVWVKIHKYIKSAFFQIAPLLKTWLFLHQER